MKKILLCFLFGLIFSSKLYSQDFDMTGIWTGVYTMPYFGQKKICLNIKRTNNEYRLRFKILDINSGEYFYYKCKNIVSDKKHIKWYTETPMVYEDGEYIYTRTFYSLHESEGLLYYSKDSSYAEFYDDNKNFKERVTIPSASYEQNIELFNDEDDW